MNAQEPGDTGFLADIRQLTAGGSHGWGELRLRHCTCTAETFPGEAIVRPLWALSR